MPPLLLTLAASSRGKRALIVAAPDTGAVALAETDDKRGAYLPIRGEGVSDALTMMAFVPLPGAEADQALDISILKEVASGELPSPAKRRAAVEHVREMPGEEAVSERRVCIRLTRNRGNCPASSATCTSSPDAAGAANSSPGYHDSNPPERLQSQ